MTQYILQANHAPFTWIDITAPSLEDFKDIQTTYALKDASIHDCLEIGHLPKIESFDSYQFLIIRSISEKFEDYADTLTEITERISIFYSDTFVITVHRHPIAFLEEIKNNPPMDKLSTSNVLIKKLITLSLRTFETAVIDRLSTNLDEYEEQVFLHKKHKNLLQKLYYIKRQIDVIRIIITLYSDIVETFQHPAYKKMYTQDLRDLYQRTSTLYRNLGENTAQLLSIFFSMESNHTNDIMRTLTIISVFFMPLTFIVGVYGMNFKHMPELEWYYGYPIIIGAMITLSAAIYIWFRKKRWL